MRGGHAHIDSLLQLKYGRCMFRLRRHLQLMPVRELVFRLLRDTSQGVLCSVYAAARVLLPYFSDVRILILGAVSCP